MLSDSLALWQRTAEGLADGYRKGLFTPPEVVDTCLARIEDIQPALNAFVHVDAAGARLAAQQSLQRWRSGTALGPLDGVPLSLKDNLNAQGQPTTWGSLLTGGFTPAVDELPVARLRAQGAVILGKTNLPEFAMQGHTTNRRFGTTVNPWNTQLSAGGSSGGAAAAVAAGCGPLAIATDGGGSIRRPASHTGLVGFKPSEACVPRARGLPELFLQYEVVGAMARSVNDLAFALQAMAPGPWDHPADSGQLRILFVPRFGTSPVDPDIAALTVQAARRMEALGHTIEEAAHFDDANDINALWPRLSATGLAWLMAQGTHVGEWELADGAEPDTRLCTDAIRETLETGKALKATDAFELQQAIEAVRACMAQRFSRHDFILTPAAAALPWPATEMFPAFIEGVAVSPRGHAVFTGLANAAGLPAVSLPCGQARGLPVGIQLIGRMGADAALLTLARNWEAAYPWAHAWPPF